MGHAKFVDHICPILSILESQRYTFKNQSRWNYAVKWALFYTPPSGQIRDARNKRLASSTDLKIFS